MNEQTKPMDYPLPARNRVPSGRLNEQGQMMFYDRPWTDEELAMARAQHYKVQPKKWRLA